MDMNKLLEEMRDCLSVGEDIVIMRTDINQEIASLLSCCSYFLITDVEDEEGASKSVLFVNAINPSSSEELQRACQAKRNIVLSGQTWATDQLRYLGYLQVRDLKASEPHGGPKLDLYVDGYDKADTEEVVFPETEICKADYVKAEAARKQPKDWQECSCFQIDSTKWSTMPRVTLPSPLQHEPTRVYQNIIFKLLVLPSVKLDGNNLRVKLDIQKLCIGILGSDILKADCLGFFPNFIKASFKPSWGRVHPSVPIYEPAMPVFSGSLDKKSKADEISMSVNAKVIKLGFKRSWQREWECETQKEGVKIVEDEEDGSVAAFEWVLLRWKNGKRYRNSKLFPGIISGPKLPFGGTGPALSYPQIPHVTWCVPSCEYDVAADVELSVEIDLRVNLCLLWWKRLPIISLPKSYEASFEHHVVMNIKLPSLTSA